MKQYVLYPFGDYDLKNKIFESPYGVLREALQERDIALNTIDLGDLKSADKVLTFNHHQAFLNKCQALGLPAEKMILFLHEPEVVMPQQYRRRVWKNYGLIFTYRDDLVDHRKIFKMRYPQGQHFAATLPGFQDRKFLTLINGHKYSYVKHELYSLRRQAIRYFERCKDFDLYGMGWDKKTAWSLSTLIGAAFAVKPFQYLRDVLDAFRPFKNYRGSVSDKYATLAGYKFALCFENEDITPGWLSEKLFDCFFTGTVPIYLGPSNVLDYVPAETFIDMRRFKNFNELEGFLRGASEEMFAAWQTAGQKFIHSEAFAAWQPEAVFRDIARHIS